MATISTEAVSQIDNHASATGALALNDSNSVHAGDTNAGKTPSHPNAELSNTSKHSSNVSSKRNVPDSNNAPKNAANPNASRPPPSRYI